MAISPGFWQGKSVLVTGHTGFKGAWLCWWLQRLGARVAGLALDPPTAPSLFELSALAGSMGSHKTDVRDLAAVDAIYKRQRPEIVFHMAAQSLVREGYRDPVTTYMTNVAGTLNCLEAARGCDSVRAVVVVTTDKCYRNRGSARGYTEEDELGGDDSYSASKACAEIVTQAYRKSFFDSGSALVASARAGNVIGGGDWATDRLVPDAIRAFSGSQALRIRNPDAIRPWQHVLEPLAGYLLLAQSLCTQNRAFASAWNFGPAAGDARPVSWVASEMAKRWGSGARWERDGTSHVAEAAILVLDSAKARSKLDWRPVLGLAEALDWVVEWHKAASDPGRTRAITLEQIQRYERMVSQ
jgi:CDP-glucose 4,6-dehydratase